MYVQRQLGERKEGSCTSSSRGSNLYPHKLSASFFHGKWREKMTGSFLACKSGAWDGICYQPDSQL